MDVAEMIADLVELSRDRLGETGAMKVSRAAVMATRFHEGQKRKVDGSPYVTHCIHVARNCLAWGMADAVGVCAALLHDAVEDAPPHMEALKTVTDFDPEVGGIVVALSKIRNLQTGDGDMPATYRRILAAAAKDLRVLIIKTFDTLHNSETFGVHDLAKAKIKASVGLIYVGVARRLGMMKLADALIERMLPHLMPVQYKKALQTLEELREAGANSMARMAQHLNPVLGEGFAHDFEIDPKKIADFFYLSEKPGTGQLRRVGWPVFRLRLLVGNDDAAWRVLGKVHSLFGPMPRHLRDYLNAPRINGFRAITSRVLWEGRPVSVHVVNLRDEQSNRLGILANWGLSGPDPARYMRLLATLGDSDLRMSEVHAHVLPDTMDVYTPKGDRLTFPVGSVVVDFAYLVHTELGEHCVGGRINGIRCPPEEPLPDGAVVEVITARNATPQRSWLDVVKTARARTLIKQALRGNRVPVKGIERKTPGRFAITSLTGPDIQWSNCCLPAPRGDMVGRLSQDGHWVVHRANCPKLEGGGAWEPGEWRLGGENVVLNVTFAIDHLNDALQPILEMLRLEGIHSPSIQGKGRASESFIVTMEWEGHTPERLGQLLEKLKTMPETREVRRYFWRA